MGVSSSTPVEDKERRERELMERMGVLIPPSFGIGAEGSSLPPSATTRGFSPSLLSCLEQKSICHHILHDHMTPGLWISATTPSQASVLAAFYVKGDSNEGMLSASQTFTNGKGGIRAYTSDSSLVSGEYSPVAGWNLMGNVNAKGMAWLGAHVNPIEWLQVRAEKKRAQLYYRNDPFANEQATNENENAIQDFQVGTFVQVQAPTSSQKSQVSVDSVLGYASMQVSGCTVAMEAKVPLQTFDPQVNYHVSANLNPDGPPLLVSMQNSPSRSSMNLSQVLTFDRIVLNAFETRCPRIRNTFAWAVQMEKTPNSDAQVMAGLAWQINRGVGCKVVAKPTGITGALLLKRWKQPRVLCSLLVGTAAPGRDIQLGIGLELETGPHPGRDFYNDTEERRVDEDVPVTRATLPDTVRGSAY